MIKAKLFVLSFILASLVPWMMQGATAIRAAIDVGSGGPKLRVAKIDLTTNKIIGMIHVQDFPVVFYESFRPGSDNILSSEIMLQGIKAITDAIKVAQSFDVDGIVIIGTSVFRNAANGDQFAKAIHLETGISVHILDQALEGKLAFQSALSQIDASAENLVVWDIGGGSMQLIGILEDDSYFVSGNQEGSGYFRDYIIESIQKRSLKEYRSPNPLNEDDAMLAITHASNLSATVDSIIKNKISKSDTKVVGVGTVFRGIKSLMANKNTFTIDDLAKVINDLVGKTDTDLGGGPFACIEVSNAVLALGFMKGLDIQQMTIVDVNNAEGAMVYKPFWE